MKSLSYKELDLMIARAQMYLGAFLEDAVYCDEILLLLFKQEQKRVSFLIDVRSRPCFWVSQNFSPKLKKQIKPISLFLKARFLGKSLKSIVVDKQWGRRVRMVFSDDSEIDLHLFPQARNIILHQAGAQMSLHKVQELKPLGEIKEDLQPRTPEDVVLDWQESFSEKKEKKPQKQEKEAPRSIEKKIQGLQNLEKRHQSLSDDSWLKVGEWIKNHQHLDVPTLWKSFIDERKDWAWNMEKAFTMAKQQREKLIVVEERLTALKKEIQELQDQPAKANVDERVAVKSVLQGAQGRTKILNEAVRAYIGKSAQDNLQILRKSKAWHLWVHIKDLPGSHGIIAFDKNHAISLDLVREVARWVVEQSLSLKQKESWRGVRCEVIYCECRFVTPIRGDKLGRVTYKNEKILSFII